LIIDALPATANRIMKSVLFTPHHTGFKTYKESPFATTTIAKPVIDNLAELRKEISICTPNPGNLIHSESPFEVIEHCKTRSAKANLLHLVKEKGLAAACKLIDESFDCVVISMANDVRINWGTESHQVYADVIKTIKIPSIILGLGLQDSAESTFSKQDQIKPQLLAFLNACNNHSAVFGTRGLESEHLLHKLGFTRATALGCPSMFRNPSEVINSFRRLLQNERPRLIGGSGYIHLRKRHHFLEKALSIYKSASCSYIFQNDLWSFFGTDLDVLAGVAYDPYTCKIRVDESFANRIKKLIGDTVFSEFRFFWNSASWYSYASAMDLFIGDRLHGCIASMTAGVPSILLYQDERVKELADFFKIPSLILNPSVITDLQADSPLLNLPPSSFYEFKENYAQKLCALDHALEDKAGLSLSARIKGAWPIVTASKL
jgi:hypothetical protein